MRGARLATSLVLSLAGCDAATDDPCEGKSGSCLALHVVGSGSIAQVDQIQVDLSGALSFVGRTPTSPGPALDLPVHAALILKNASGPATVAVAGFLRGATVGNGSSSVSVTPGAHESVTVTLTAPSGGDAGARDLAHPDDATTDGNPPLPDLARGDDFAFDGGSADLSLADLAVPPDLSSPDLSLPDLAPPPDLAPAPRLVFLLPAQGSNLNGLAGADSLCTANANQNGYKGTFRAILSIAATDAVARIALGQGRDIVLPTGTRVATDATLWNGQLLAPIDRQANGAGPSTACVFTDTKPNGLNAGTNDCTVWGALPFGNAVIGSTKQVNGGWIDNGTNACNISCHVYCIEQ